MKIELIWLLKRSHAHYRPTTIRVLKDRWEIVSDKGAMLFQRVLVQGELILQYLQINHMGT
jgi:hypothetical protein